jgi:hypothetical protein
MAALYQYLNQIATSMNTSRISPYILIHSLYPSSLHHSQMCTILHPWNT